MARPYATPEQWGQERTIPVGAWATGQPQVVLQRDPPPEELAHLPQVNTLLCGVVNDDSDVTQDYSLRWELTLGVGGARVPIRFDAVGVTRLSVPTEGFTLSLVVESFPPPFPQGDLPAGLVHAFAMIGEKGIGQTIATGATHTTVRRLITVGAADAFDVLVPPGASAVRLVGKNATGGGTFTPFRPQLQLNMMQGSTIVANLVGEGALAADPSLRTLFYSGLWFPLPGSLTKMQLGVTDFPTTTNCALQFKLDL